MSNGRALFAGAINLQANGGRLRIQQRHWRGRLARVTCALFICRDQSRLAPFRLGCGEFKLRRFDPHLTGCGKARFG